MTAINLPAKRLKCTYCIYADCFIPADINICLCTNTESNHYGHLLAVGIHGCERGVPVIKASEKTKPVSTISELTLGERIKAIRKAWGLNQAAFAEQIGSHLQTVSKYERGEIKPSVDTLSSIVTVFSVDADWLLTGRKK